MEEILEYNRFPAINTFIQFNRPISILSPLDLSLRSSLIPITPPSTPSPPRKRLRNSEENTNVWRPHSLGYFNNSHLLAWSTSELRKISEKFDETIKSENNHSHLKHRFVEEEIISLTEDEVENDSVNDDDDDDEEFVDILSNDDDVPPITILNNNEKPNQQKINDIVEEQPTGVLSNEQLVYEDPALHIQAVEGFAKLFENSGSGNDKVFPSQSVFPSQPTDLNQNDSCTQQNLKTLIKNNSEKRKLKIRKQIVDEDNTSPVSGTIIRKLRDDEELVVTKGDIDPAFNVVEITEEAKSILASIDNKIGSYICQLCRTMYDDAFQLAQHRCARIVHIEYRCSECDKVFNCPANLASHRRWHKPKSEVLASQNKKTNPSDHPLKILPPPTNTIEEKEGNFDENFSCQECGKGFRRLVYLKKHLTSHQMINDLKSLETFKTSSGQIGNSLQYPLPKPNPLSVFQSSNTSAANLMSNYHHQQQKLYPGAVRFPTLFQHFDQRCLHPFSEFYFPQHLDRNSAFQYGQTQQNLRGLSGVAAQHNSPLVGAVK